jgi:hypothetical protein
MIGVHLGGIRKVADYAAWLSRRLRADREAEMIGMELDWTETRAYGRWQISR